MAAEYKEEGGGRKGSTYPLMSLWNDAPFCQLAMTYLVLKYLHVLGAIVLLGTGTGIAFFMLMAHRSGDSGHIARTAATVVVADVLFTATAVVLQPVTGWLLARETGLPLTKAGCSPRSRCTAWPGFSGCRWCGCSGACAISRAPRHDKGAPLPAEYHRLYRLWFLFGFPGFGSVLVIVWLMIAKPSF